MADRCRSVWYDWGFGPVPGSLTSHGLPDRPLPARHRLPAAGRSGARAGRAGRGPRTAATSTRCCSGVTGSGKTFTMARVIAETNRPTLVMAHNKTLAAQLYQEFRRFFPHNAVEYFVSYYDYYQPEAYVPASDTYIEKESTINDEIDRMRLSATRSLFERRDVIIVASVSCIYGLGSPEAYYGMVLPLTRGQRISRQDVLRKLVEIQYERNDVEFGRGTFRVRGDTIEVHPVLRRARAAHRPVRRRDRRAGGHRPAHRQDAAPPRPHLDLPEVDLRDVARQHQARRRDDQGRAGRAPRRPRARGQAARSAAAAPADDVRPRDDPRDRLLPRHRELLAAPDGPRAGRAAADAARLPARGRRDRRRREPPDRAAGPRDVRRRPVAQGSAGVVRLPAAVGARQPAAELRRVGAARRPARLRVGDARSLRAAASPAGSSSSRSSGRPA